ncbi:porin family protein [Vibrio ulleungensis]|uniref:Porin family protein n=1 Tax=Vibrio ulleungensis TaxID=2807619 RepID=A0ABS2HGK0_9VIBR|nr:porin family protein [Vibrio ulleungensis]MBM7036665.1 porin family protein [Vibrio ulleungensis]
MKKFILASTLAIISASTFAAGDNSGLRVGGGFGADIGSNTLSRSTGGDLELDPALALEAGYEFNGIFGINVKGSGTGLSANQSKSKSTNLGTMYDLSVEAEAGYTFNLDNGVSIKPYAAVGGVGFDKDTSKLLGFNGKNEVAFKGRGAAGVRMTLDNGLYVDGRIQATDFSVKGDTVTKDDLLTQGLITVGYKF